MKEINYPLFESLKAERAALEQAILDKEKELDERLFIFLDNISKWKEAELAPIKTTIEYTSDWNKERTYTAYVRFYLNWYRVKGDEKEKSNRDIDLTIYRDHIKITYDSASNLTREEKDELARTLMLSKLFENEYDLCQLTFSIVNINDLDHLKDTRHKIYEIENDIRQNKEEQEKNDAEAKLLSAKFIYECNRNKRYDYDLHRYTHIDYHFFNKFVIEKITEKSIIGYYEQYRWDRKRLDRGSVNWQIRSKTMVAVTEEPKDYTEDIPEGDPSND